MMKSLKMQLAATAFVLMMLIFVAASAGLGMSLRSINLLSGDVLRHQTQSTQIVTA